jgi:murein DD-endopeptidase MepM/ murein hydrolase activator NlpD
MGTALRASLFLSATAALGACVSNPEHRPAPIDFRGVAAHASGPAPGTVMASATPPSAQQPRFSSAPVQPSIPAPASNEPAPLQLVADLGPSAGLSATDEARAMAALQGGRPGGARRIAPDDPASRMVTVLAGDTLYDISRRYNVNMRALIETNQLQPPYALSVGTTVQLPPPNIHIVQRGETLYAVSRRYNVDTRSLALLNGMTRPWAVWPGDELLLPPLARDQAREPARVGDVAPLTVAAIVPIAPMPVPLVPAPATPKPSQLDSKPIQLAPAPAPAKPPLKPAAAPTAVSPPAKPPAAAPPPAPKPVAPKPTAQPSAGAVRDFVWPVSGSVLKAYGASANGARNDGVNIAAPKGAPIKAAAGGEVVYAGNELAGFGNLILIRHPGGWVTAYAHADTIAVKEGDLVKQGQQVGTVGSTGNVSSPQIHFELRKGKEPVDPGQHLPPL